ncbi:MAG TPA: cysteine--tRNA ligase [Bacteroidales bacterium]|nr:cysteine--tRNA ligase [Bacteroidales bacterium]
MFVPLHTPHVGMYVCGPTVYGDAHLGHARPAINFDLLFRFLKYSGYKVRYVRNITDVGHLENDADDGEDKIAKKARLEALEPMEVVQYYTDRYHINMDALNVLRPSIEPRASGHIIEQIELTKRIIHNGFAYVVNGSVYFDVDAFNKKFNYGRLSGRVIEDLYSTTRELDGQSEKRKSYDFALWKKASPSHIMHWPSPWSEGFPGWHMECSAMGMKYLGEEFDIHGGGMDLLFPHHECEVAQSAAALGKDTVRYWMHNNMITINGQKMGKSLGNFITLDEVFSGKHELLAQAYSPMTVRFFILMAHYRGTLDFSNEALQAAEKGLNRLLKGMALLQKIKTSAQTSHFQPEAFETKLKDALNDDLNSPVLIAHLFDGLKTINNINQGSETISESDLNSLKKIYHTYVTDILGLLPQEESNQEILNNVVDMVLNIRLEAKRNKDFTLSDTIRNRLGELGIAVRDSKDGFEWEIQ